MISFKPIELEDKETIESFTQQSSIRNCDLSFANMYCWQPTYKSAWAIIEGYLVIRFHIDGGERIGYMQPIGGDGNLDFSGIIPFLAQDAHSHGDRLRIIGLTDEGKASLKSSYSENFALHSDPNFEDYIYASESLRTLTGKRLQPKRNHINQFQKRHPNYGYYPLTADHFDECLSLDCRWRASNGEDCQAMTPERVAMLRAFECFDELGLRGGVLYVDGEMAAFTYGSPINSDTFCIHVEKGETEYIGCYAVINKLFAESLPPEYKYINREEDLGIEGLRRSKLSYYPELRQVKHTAIYLHHDERECRSLWQSVFGDDDLFVDEFIIYHYSESHMLRVTDAKNRYISMLHIIPFESEIGRIAYIYGVATHPEYRGMGYASKLMNSAMELIGREGYDAAALIPSEEWLFDYYSRFGFVRGSHITFRSYNNFDFGQGDPSLDNSMICPINDTSATLPSELTLTKK